MNPDSQNDRQGAAAGAANDRETDAVAERAAGHVRRFNEIVGSDEVRQAIEKLSGGTEILERERRRARGISEDIDDLSSIIGDYVKAVDGVENLVRQIRRLIRVL